MRNNYNLRGIIIIKEKYLSLNRDISNKSEITRITKNNNLNETEIINWNQKNNIKKREITQ